MQVMVDRWLVSVFPECHQCSLVKVHYWIAFPRPEPTSCVVLTSTSHTPAISVLLLMALISGEENKTRYSCLPREVYGAFLSSLLEMLCLYFFFSIKKNSCAVLKRKYCQEVLTSAFSG